jgi:hypothetical protein
MAKDPGFLFYPGDYLRDTQCLSEKAQVAYDRIMCEHMRNICITQDQLNFFTKRLSEDEKMELMMVVVKKDCGYQIEWVAESICKRKEYSASRRKNRSSKGNNISDTYDSHMDNENEIVIEDEKIEKEEKFNFKKSMVSYGFSERLVSEWVKVRKAKSLVNTETAFKKFIAEVEKGKPESLDKLLEDIVSRSWGGFKWDWLKNEKLNNNGRGEQVERKPIEHKKDFTGGFRKV